MTTATRRPFRPGDSNHAENPDGSFVRCGRCRGWLELVRADVRDARDAFRPVLEGHNGRLCQRWDYHCADHDQTVSYYVPLPSSRPDWQDR